MVLIFTSEITNRLSYVVSYIFNAVLGVPATLTTNKDEYLTYPNARLNYSHELLPGIQMIPHGLLFEKGVRSFEVEFTMFHSMPVIFPVTGSSEFSFDPFAASFYMLSRYEEYLPHQVDHHGRASASGSLAYKKKFLEIPVVNHWALYIKQTIQYRYPGYLFPERRFTFIPTIDIDAAFAYRGRSMARTSGAVLRALLKNDWEDQKRRFQTLVLHKPDPYDTFQLLNSWHHCYNLKPVYFFLVGKYGPYDKNSSPLRARFRKIVQEIKQTCDVGIHPSYGSNRHTTYLKKEIRMLENIIHEPVKRSRQHFLMLRFPDTYLHLLKNGITEDYSMGYASQPGFRAGTCTPFPFYDLSKEEQTPLLVYPFQVMDGTLNQYLRLSPLEATTYVTRLIDEVKKVNGTFISLWHNESLSEIRNWHRWQEVYVQLLSYGTKA